MKCFVYLVTGAGTDAVVATTEQGNGVYWAFCFSCSQLRCQGACHQNSFYSGIPLRTFLSLFV